jgi:phage-related protein
MKDVVFVGSSKRDLKEFPDEARAEAGHAIYLAQCGERAINAMPLTGFGSSKVVELVIPEGGDAYRAVYTVRFDTAVYVLHCFQKKSSKGCKTPQHDMKLVRSRLKDAEAIHRAAKKPTELEKIREQGSGQRAS